MHLRIVFAISVFSSFVISSIGTIGSIPITFVGWLFPLIISHLVLFNAKRLPKALSYTFFFWVVFILGHGIASSAPNAIQRSIIIVTPMFVALAAASLPFVEQDLKRIYSFILYTSFAFLLVIFAKAFLFKTASIDRLAAESIAAVCLGWICFILYKAHRSLILLASFLLIISIPLLGANRGPLMALLLALVLAPPIRSIRHIVYKAIIAFCLGVGMLVLYPPLADKMFHAGYSFADGFSDSDTLQTSGRLNAWDVLIDGISDAPYFGHGGNASESFLTFTVSEAFSHPHNDYLRILYDYGTLGLLLFLLTNLYLIGRCTHSYINTDKNTEVLGYIAYGLYIPFLFLMSIDNILLYAAFFGNVHFLFIGINESIRRSKKPAAKNAPIEHHRDSINRTLSIGKDS